MMDLEMRPLTSGMAFDDRPVVSPDGKQVAFHSERGGDDDGGQKATGVFKNLFQSTDAPFHPLLVIRTASVLKGTHFVYDSRVNRFPT